MTQVFPIMSQLSQAVSIHPYFKINPGCVDNFKSIISQFVERTQPEENCHYYDFSICGEMAFCREAYADADAVLFHLENVGAQIEATGECSEMIRLEIHGPAEELAKLKAPLAELPVEYYEHIAGVQR